MPQQNLPPWIQPLQQRDPKFVEWYMSQREHILRMARSRPSTST
jgi:hypothetical protein